jgi:hypothetical protein
MYYFDRITSEEGEWFDSAAAMKARSLEQMIRAGKWKQVGMAFTVYQHDKPLIIGCGSVLKNSLIKEAETKADVLYDFIDDNREKMPEGLAEEILKDYEEDVFCGYVWNGIKDFRGQALYFEREEVKSNNKKRGDEDEKEEKVIDMPQEEKTVPLQGKSVNFRNGWGKGMIIYKDIRYDKEGIWDLNPRIFRNSYYGYNQYFGKRGSVEILNRDTLKIDYERTITVGRNVVYFVRGEERRAEE